MNQQSEGQYTRRKSVQIFHFADWDAPVHMVYSGFWRQYENSGMCRHPYGQKACIGAIGS